MHETDNEFQETLRVVESLSHTVVLVPNLANFELMPSELIAKIRHNGIPSNPRNGRLTLLYCLWQKNYDETRIIEESPVTEIRRDYEVNGAKVLPIALPIKKRKDYAALMESIGTELVSLGADEIVYFLDCKEPIISMVCTTLASTYLPGIIIPIDTGKAGAQIDTDKVGFALRNIQVGLSTKSEIHLPLEFSKLKEGKLKEIARSLTKLAGSMNPPPLLLLGETGVGKSWWANAYGKIALGNSTGKFVVRNCSAIPENLLESELFGYKQGAFTGALKDKDGALKTADQGVLFLDEIADLPMHLQAKLLTSLTKDPDHKKYPICPVGATDNEYVDFVLVCATRKDLKEEVVNGNFREDLYYRIAGFPITIPPLCERPDDLESLIEEFSQSRHTGFSAPLKLTQEIIDLLKAHPWKGNIRELEFMIGGLAVQTELGTIPNAKQVAKMLQDRGLPDSPTIELKGIWSKIDRKDFEAVYQKALTIYALKREGIRERAAEWLGMSVAQLDRWYKGTETKAKSKTKTKKRAGSP